MRSHYDVGIVEGRVVSLTGQEVCLIGLERDGDRWRCHVSAEFGTEVQGVVLAHHPGGPMIAVALQRAVAEAGDEAGDGTYWLDKADLIEFAKGALALEGWASEVIPLGPFGRIAARLRL